jgi:organic radical activating enzyme
MHCTYCDEIHKVGKEWSLDQTLNEILRLESEQGPHQHISLTGGEPLLYLPFLKPLLARLRSHGFSVYLETSGVLWKALEEIVDFCDVIAMDLKPASVTLEKSYLEEHRPFLKIGSEHNLFIKMVLSKKIDLDEFDALVSMVAQSAPNVALYLQPLTAEIEGHDDPQLMDLLVQLQTRGQKWLKDIRIGLRLHRILNIR